MKAHVAAFALLIILTACLELSAQLVQKGANPSTYVEPLTLLKRLSQ